MINECDIEAILMSYGCYEHSIGSLEGLLTLNDNEISSVVKEIYEYVIQNIE